MLTETLAHHDSAVFDPLPYAEPAPLEAVEAPPLPVNEHSLLGLAEVLLKAPAQLDAWVRDPARQPELIPRLLFLALSSLALYSAVLALLLASAPISAVPFVLEHWNGSTGAAAALALAYPVGMTAATGICLPTFYFFGLLAGVRITVLQVTTHVLKGKAATAVLLLGLTPIYLTIALGMLIFQPTDDMALSVMFAIGLALPFVAGLWGMRSLYVGFLGLADTLPPERRYRRTCFLRRLTIAWTAVYVAVTPVMIWSLYHNLAVRLG